MQLGLIVLRDPVITWSRDLVWTSARKSGACSIPVAGGVYDQVIKLSIQHRKWIWVAIGLKRYFGLKSQQRLRNLISWPRPRLNRLVDHAPISADKNTWSQQSVGRLFRPLFNNNNNNNNNVICDLQLPGKPHRSARLLQLTGRWQYNRIM